MIGDDAELFVDFSSINDVDCVRDYAWRMGIKGYRQAYVAPEFARRVEAERFLDTLRRRGLHTVRAFDETSDEEIFRIVAEEVTLW